MILKKVVPVLAIVLMVTTSVQAMVVPGRWEKVEALKQGSIIVVTLDTGDILQGEFATLEEESIRMTVDDQEREYPKSAVSKINQIEMGWSRKKKAGIGAAIGSAIGFGLGAAIGGGKYGEGKYAIAGGLFLGVIGGGIGATAGLAEQTSKEIVIYEANSASAENRTE